MLGLLYKVVQARRHERGLKSGIDVVELKKLNERVSSVRRGYDEANVCGEGQQRQVGGSDGDFLEERHGMAGVAGVAR
ncbi:hypothetical protein PHSY_000626 [Pseudozyma hubeiensis SY62]|uniref:Uncharacterized protein n=1 Tax=Pseudozyma hubeiensis (strain SY62) TaxID=1305764 RepID=R9P4N0_PSEHS|nr:hypothetical protein PHSY_000626 [Pseudozyma hubeiensis SY62]GAC93065.1 hypothetical protein PHSY_000626 [Pseudozyma hubeiensis SY62]